MRIGYGKSDITPPLGVELAGYGYYLARKAEAVLDPLYARAVALEDQSGERALIISCDLLGLNRQIVADIERDAAACGVKPEHIIIVSVHTHTGPACIWHEGCGYPDPAYVSTVAGRIFASVKMALDDLSEVDRLTFSVTALPGKDPAEDAAAGTGRHGFAVASDESGYTFNRAMRNGPVDRFARGFVVCRRGKPPLSIVSAACHGVFNDRIPLISADWAGAVNRALEARGCCSIVLNGTCGDIDPTRKERAWRDAFAEAVAGVVDAPMRELPLTFRAGQIDWRLHTVAMDGPARDALCQRVAERDGADAVTTRVARIWAEEMPSHPERMTGEESAPSRYVILGGVPIVAYAFEGFTRTAQLIREESGCPDALVLGCAGELMGYLPTREDIEAASYAAQESVFLYKRMPACAGEAERLGTDVGRALRGLTGSAD